MEKLKLSEVKLTEGLFKEREKVDRNYLMELDSRALLQNFYLEAGIILPELAQVSDPVNSYLHWGWEAPSCQLRGHFLGHWMSAAAFLVAENKDRELEGKLYNIIDELKKCQINNGGQWIGSIPEKYFKRLETKDYIWSPQYTLHKTLMGLLDAYEATGYELAMDILDNASDWYLNWVDSLKENPNVIVKGEAGGMLEIWARLYILTGKDKYMNLAEAYSNYNDFTLLDKGEDALTDNHANASIPEAHGAACMYEATGDDKWLKRTEEFWKQAVTDREAYATGGQNAGEFWIAPGHFYEAASDRTQEFCTMYNMVRLAEYLYRFTGRRVYTDYIERSLYNAFLVQQNKFTGMPTYFLPMKAGSRKVWGSKRNDFWCCTGTMVQSQTIYPGLCYYKDEAKNLISIDQYINSEADFSINEGKVSIKQSVDMNYCQGALFGEERNGGSKSRWSIKFEVNSEKEINLRFRIPAWTKGRIYVNDKLITTEEEYYVITKTFENESIRIFLPSSITEEGLSDNKNITAILDGPIVLAAVGEEGRKYSLEGQSADKKLLPYIEHTYDTYPWLQNNYKSYSANDEITIKPLYEVTDEIYTIYVNK